MQPVLFDASIYISALRRGDDPAFSTRQLSADSPIWLSAVVLEELYAGTGERGRDLVERLEQDFDRIKRILVPSLADWTLAGAVLSKIAVRYGYDQIGRGRLTNDALIAMSAARMSIRVITSNEKDFRRLAEFRTFQWHVMKL